MSIPIQGILTRRSVTIHNAIAKQLKLINLKPLTKITVQFDPFDERAKHARDLLSHLSGPKYLKTNLSCILKSNVVCDRTKPVVKCDLTNGEKIIFKLEHLDTLDVLKLFNEHISSLVPVEKPPQVGIIRKKKAKRNIKKIIPRNRR